MEQEGEVHRREGKEEEELEELEDLFPPGAMVLHSRPSVLDLLATSSDDSEGVAEVVQPVTQDSLYLHSELQIPPFSRHSSHFNLYSPDVPEDSKAESASSSSTEEDESSDDDGLRVRRHHKKKEAPQMGDVGASSDSHSDASTLNSVGTDKRDEIPTLVPLPASDEENSSSASEAPYTPDLEKGEEVSQIPKRLLLSEGSSSNSNHQHKRYIQDAEVNHSSSDDETLSSRSIGEDGGVAVPEIAEGGAYTQTAEVEDSASSSEEENKRSRETGEQKDGIVRKSSGSSLRSNPRAKRDALYRTENGHKAGEKRNTLLSSIDTVVNAQPAEYKVDLGEASSRSLLAEFGQTPLRFSRRENPKKKPLGPILYFDQDAEESSTQSSESEVSDFETVTVEELEKIIDANSNPTALKKILLHISENQEEMRSLVKKQLIRFSTVDRAIPARDWSQEFQMLKEMPEGLSKFTRLSHLAHDFVYCATTYGKIILSEVCLPVEEKTIKPVAVGGLAGGTKYIAQGILFKFARDLPVGEGWMYGGSSPSDEKAMKAASHEFKGIVSYNKLNIPNLSIPLIAILDYRGFRLIAMSVLPIGKETIQYGSCDGGFTIHNDNRDLSSKMRQAARRLNLKGHWILNSGIKIYGPGDVEGHVGYDGKFYVVDLARVYPPQAPQPDDPDKRAVFYKLLRPELVRTNPTKLSSDAFTGWGVANKEKYNEGVSQATQRLLTEVIPNFAAKLQKSDPQFLTGLEIVQKMHRNGINLRFLGRLRSLTVDPRVRLCLLHELVARILKNIIREKLRMKMRERGALSEAPYRIAILKLLNNIVLWNKKIPAKKFWTETIKLFIMDKFPLALNDEELNPLCNLREGIDLHTLFKRIQETSSITFGSLVLTILAEKPDSFTLSNSDIEELSARVKYMNTVDYSEGMALSIEASLKHGRESDRLYELAHKKFQMAFSSVSDDFVCLFQWGKCFHQQAIKHRKEKTSSQKELIALLSNARKKYALAISINPQFYECHFHYGTLLCKMAILEKKSSFTLEASQLFKQAVELHPDYWRVLYLKAKQKHYKSRKKVGESSEFYLEMAVELILVVLKFQKDPQIMFQAGQWMCSLEMLRMKRDTVPKGMFVNASKMLEAATLLDNNLCRELVNDAVNDFKAGRKSSGFQSEQLFIRADMKFSLALNLDSNCCNGALNWRELERESIGVFLKVAPKKMVEKWMKFSSLDLSNNLDITDVALVKLLDTTASSSLTNLNLASCLYITDYSMKQITKKLPNLTSLSLNGCSNLIDKSAKKIATFAKKLTKLDLSGCYQITGSFLDYFPSPILTDLNMSECTHINDSDLATLGAKLPSLSTLILDDCFHLNQVNLLSKLQKLKHLSLVNCKKINSDSVEIAFKHCTNLQRVNLHNCSRVSSGAIRSLIAHSLSLKELDVEGCSLEFKAANFLSASNMELIRMPRMKDFNGSYLKKMCAKHPNLHELNIVEASTTDSAIHKLSRECAHLKVLGLAGCTKISSNALSKLVQTCVGLEQLDLTACSGVGKPVIEALARHCTNLQTLLLGTGSQSTKMPPELVLHVVVQIGERCKNLTKLDLSRSMIKDDDFQILTNKSPQLINLNMSGCSSLTNKAVKYLSLGCHNLQELDLSRCPSITFFAVKHLSSGCTALKKLDISRCSPVIDRAPIVRLPALISLTLVNCPWVNEVVLMALCQGCPRLQFLDMEACPKLNDTGISFLAKRCGEIRHLVLEQVIGATSRITDRTVKALLKCRKLELLDLTACNITQASMPLFHTGFPNLHTVTLPSQTITREQQQALHVARPWLKVRLEP